ncbi:MAG: glycosyltransferase [Eubacteriales bacterium]
MKVLLINSVCGYGSTGRIVTDLYKSLVEQGHQCLIAYGRGTAPSEIDSIRIGTVFDNYMHVAKTRLFDLHGFASSKATKDFIKVAKKYNPDVIHLHNIHGYYIDIKLLFEYLKEANKPIVWTLHDCWTFTGHCTHFDYIGCNKWKEECYCCPQKTEYPRSIFADNSLKNYRRKKELFTGLKNMTIITPSIWLGELVKESYLKEYNLIVINNGIDLSIFKPKEKTLFRYEYNLNNEFIILGVASVWTERKGMKYFLELSKLIDNNSRIVLVGLSDKQLKNLPKNIIGIHRTSNPDQLSEIYSAADVFVNPTLEDNYPTTNLEALACGTPVITFNTGGSVESVDEDTGMVVQKGNLPDLFHAVERLHTLNIEQKACLRKSLSFNKNDKYKKYLDIYMNIC